MRKARNGTILTRSTGKVHAMSRKILGAVLMGALLVSTAACNTVKGLGEDIKSVGEAGEKAID